MTRLYIIGNGFDRWHDLPTSYNHFYFFAKEYLDEIAQYYSLDLSKSCPWHDFENALGAFNWNEFYDEHNHIDASTDDFRPSEVFGLQDDLIEQTEEHVEKLRELFREWIESIDVNVVERKLCLQRGARFISFNYTSTLESVYGVNTKDVLHIHGNVDAHEELVFGHGEVMAEVPELDENGDSNRTMFSDAEAAAKYPFIAFKKPVDEILDTHKEFFETLKTTRDITVIGHSINKIDLPYYENIAKRAKDARWTVCLYKAEEEMGCAEALTTCGVSREQIQFCTYDEL